MQGGALFRGQRRQDVVKQFGARGDDTAGLPTTGAGEFDYRHTAVGSRCAYHKAVGDQAIDEPHSRR